LEEKIFRKISSHPVAQENVSTAIEAWAAAIVLKTMAKTAQVSQPDFVLLSYGGASCGYGSYGMKG
jgi:hypothetical protein